MKRLNLHQAYLLSLKAAGRAKGTIRLHAHYIDMLGRRIPSLARAKTGDLEEILATPGWSPETMKSCRGVMRAFFRWLHENGHIPTNPAAKLAPIKVPAGVARPCPEMVFRAALAKADYELRLMLMLAAFAGLRAHEIAKVHTRDFDGRMLYVKGKGGKTRVVPIADSTLKAALRECPGYLFPSPYGAHYTAGHVTKRVSAALPPGWTCHTLRHRFGTAAYAGTKNLLAVQKLLGHSSPTTTQRYIQLPEDELLAAVMSAA